MNSPDRKVLVVVNDRGVGSLLQNIAACCDGPKVFQGTVEAVEHLRRLGSHLTYVLIIQYSLSPADVETVSGWCDLRVLVMVEVAPAEDPRLEILKTNYASHEFLEVERIMQERKNNRRPRSAYELYLDTLD